MSKMTYDQKQILALRGLSGIIFTALTQEQKNAIKNGISTMAENHEHLAQATPEQTIDFKEIYSIMSEIITGK